MKINQIKLNGIRIMIAQAAGAKLEMVLLAPEKVQPANSVALNKDSTPAKVRNSKYLAKMV